MIFSRSKEPFFTRLTINNCKLDQIPATKLLGVWITEDLSWQKNTQEICRKAYARLSMLTKLKYVGVSTEDLIDIYILYIRSLTEYCATAFHSSLTLEQSTDLERSHKTCLRVILGGNYVSYTAALEMTGQASLIERREKRCLEFALRCIKHPINKKIFPQNPNLNQEGMEIRSREVFVVNHARTESYKKSAVPYCQRLLNTHFQE